MKTGEKNERFLAASYFIRKGMPMNYLYGITVALLTPFTSNYEVDYDKLAELTRWLISKGIHCLFCCGTDSE